MSFSQKEISLITDSPLFDPNWYSRTYPDVALTGMSPTEHFLRFGAMLGRDPGPDFCTADYLRMYSDVARAGINALVHFEQYGRKEGRRTRASHSPDVRGGGNSFSASKLQAPIRNFATEAEARETIKRILSATLDGKPQKLFSSFDTELEDELLSAVAMLYAGNRRHFEGTKVSVIMPTYNRGDRIAQALRSVQAQTHGHFELLIVDDGSTDNTREVLEGFADDTRIRTFWNNHKGVSAARNTGLQNATGSLIFYLDSDNVWVPDFLSAMVVAFDITETDCMYGASRLQNARKEVIGYRGEPFNWDQCLSGNYIDMNVFGHRAEMVKRYGPFDETLERMVDWDLILRYTRENAAAYCPVLGCIYFEDSDDASRITTSKPYIFRKIVYEKNKMGLATTAETFDRLSLKFAIKIPAPFAVRMAWGDFHYAESLKHALEKLGHEVRIDFLEGWDKHPVRSTDVTLVLRGLSAYEPKPSEFSILWNISHPDQISYEEYSSYKLIFVASTSYAALLSKVLERPVYPLLQCTDSSRFSFRAHENHPDDPGVFVGNSRNEFREIVRWSVESGIAIDIYGQRWENFVPDEMVRKDNVPNNELADVYANARFVLNDHWASMRDFGIVSNRIFDVVGCGGRLVSDRIDSIDQLLGGVVEMVDSKDDLKATLDTPFPPVSQAQRRAASDLVHAEHSFDARAAQIVDHIGRALVRTKAAGAPQNEHQSRSFTPGLIGRRKRVGLILQHGRAWPTSSAFIRLIAPLTSDYASTRLEIVILNGVEDPQLDECDICIVQRIAVREEAAANILLKRLRLLGVSLYVDTDDAFHLHDQHKADDTVLQTLMAAARETWFSTPALEALYRHVPGAKRVLRNNLDPRFWRNYRKQVSTAFDAPKVRFLYMGTATHDGDFQEVLPAFERLGREMPDTFDLTLVGAVRKPPLHDWIRRLPPPMEKGSYPQFVRWLSAQAQFDVGIAPLVDSPFNRAKSDIKILDYGAMGLLPLVSECTAYDDAITQGLAVGCRRDAADWYEKAAAIIKDRARFEPMRQQAFENVWEQRNVLKASHEIVDLLVG
ncbi:Spore coat polysaccharide biosynthesis protein SpsA [Phaeobacter sp. CECT 5382]|uniref:glycosyltransferase n=1 Tax=Phaeobacter sp. CECT 5382 TaxID=1712645 RepID=UPI0006DA7AE7|nr:glycosyltransferase [Phaeobacter sp. CECT 5382]CUH89896.1 Spore coat polysaccharide biosynthesis protein SpsA [Phaeobacter sp. CECT 5382]